MKKHFYALSFLVFFSLLIVQQGTAANIKVMTQNQYIGAAIERFLAASDPVSFNEALVTALKTVAANKPAERMQAIANEIINERPSFVGLQEVVQLQCIDSVQAPGVGCNDPFIAEAFSDHLQLTLDALNGTYAAAATVINFNVSVIPFLINGVLAQLSLVDRDVILARADVTPTPVTFPCLKPSADGCNYTAALQVSTPFGTIEIQVAQAAELLRARFRRSRYYH